jgi:hypothetical protein
VLTQKDMKNLQVQMFERAQETRQMLIERAVENLAKQTNQEQTILNKQAADIKEREDKAIADKEAKLHTDTLFVSVYSLI